jgi:predicted HicB family RNase H-like nuclease
MTAHTDHYTYRVQWSAEDESFVGTVAEFPSLSWLDEDPVKAIEGIRHVVADVVTDMAENGEDVPAALVDRAYSGKFQVRIPPEVHRRLAIEAAEQHVSLNRLAAARLSAA